MFSLVLLCHSTVSQQCHGCLVVLFWCHHPRCCRGTHEVLTWHLLWEALQLSSTHGGSFYHYMLVLWSVLRYFISFAGRWTQNMQTLLPISRLALALKAVMLSAWCMWHNWVTGCDVFKCQMMNWFQEHTRKNSCAVLEKVLNPEKSLLQNCSTSKENRENNW